MAEFFTFILYLNKFLQISKRHEYQCHIQGMREKLKNPGNPGKLNRFVMEDDSHDKPLSILDDDGEAADLEMQLSKSDDDLKSRAVYYTAMLLAGQPSKGKKYKETKRVYQIFFLNFELFPESKKIPRRYFYMEENEHDRLSFSTEIIFYEMPKLEQHVNDFLEGRTEISNLPQDEKWYIQKCTRYIERVD